MNEPEETDIQRLIRLKRYEQPPEGFVDDFLIQFHHRQRSEILRQSSFRLFWDRLTAFMDGRMSPGVGYASAVAAAVAIMAAVMWAPHGGDGSGVASTGDKAAAQRRNANEFTASPQIWVDGEREMLNPPKQLLLGNHFEGGYATERRLQERSSDPNAGRRFQVNGLMVDPNDMAERALGQPLLSTPDLPVQQNGSAANIHNQ